MQLESDGSEKSELLSDQSSRILLRFVTKQHLQI